METEPEHRAVWLERALRLLHAGTDIDCDDARELVGIAQCEGCG